PAAPAAAQPAQPAPPAGRGGRWALGALAGVTAALLAVGGGLAVRDLVSDDGRITGSGPSVVPQAGVGADPVAAPTSPAGEDDPGPTTTAPPTAAAEPSPTATAPLSATRKATRTKTATRRPSSAPAGTPSAESGVPRSFAGVWTGTATQRGGIVTSFDVTMRLGRGADRGTIVSSTLGCTGVVDVVGKPTASVLRLHQRTTRSGDGLCALGADITMTKRSTNRSAWAWVDDTEPTNTANAVLTRS
ncbi:MAG: hypothetical protein HY830_22505, partial [Actinobacteria bacterium]|nr:hypothetical protein [Actinomycetota bacterium]